MEPLKERPNQWALIKECPSRQTAATTAARLRKRDADGNRFAELPDGEFEITARDNRIYARYLDGDATPF
jgi:hypothetical protein